MYIFCPHRLFGPGNSVVTEKDCISSNYSCLIINQEMQTTTEALGLVKEGRGRKVFQPRHWHLGRAGKGWRKGRGKKKSGER